MRDSALIQFTDHTRAIHSHLHSTDDCYYLIEYTSNRSYDYSDANQFISNLKKSPLRRGSTEYWHKEKAIALAAQKLREQLPDEWLQSSTFVPVPPSKASDDPEFDDRLIQVLAQIGAIDVREIVYQRESMEPTHALGGNRHSVEDLVDNYEIDENKTDPAPSHIVIFDDLLTAGTHFRAMRLVLGHRFPGVPFSGVFLARRVFATNGE
jgi:hypothetical protein